MRSRSRSNQTKGFLVPKLKGCGWQFTSLKRDLNGFMHQRRMRARKVLTPQMKCVAYKTSAPKYQSARRYCSSRTPTLNKMLGTKILVNLRNIPKKKRKHVVSKLLPTFISLEALGVGVCTDVPSSVSTLRYPSSLAVLRKRQRYNVSFNNFRVASLSHSFKLTNYCPTALNVSTNWVAKNDESVHPTLSTRSSQHFTLRSPIMFLTQFFIKNTLQNLIPKFIFKKKIFSFLKPNEVRQALMNRKKQLFTYKLVFNQKALIYKSLNFSPLKLKQLYTTLVTTNLKNSQPLFSNSSQSMNRTFSLQHQLSDVLNADTFDLRGTSQLFQRLEVKIPRVRFKPGYQRM